jgi:ubiquinone/menaquinone biosynthesis C-methylase UbiE
MRRLWWSFLRLFFRLLYTKFAWTYDLVAWSVSLGEWRTWGRAAIPYLQGERVLELAHGPGHLLATMAGQGFSSVGLDLSPHMGRLAKRRLGRAGLAIPQVRARAQALPFREGCFHSVVAAFPTEFILDPLTLREAARALHGHGRRLVVVASARLGGRTPLSRFIRWLYRATGQDKPLPQRFEAVMKDAGLVPRLVQERVGRSTVTLIVAEKQSLTAGGRPASENGLSTKGQPGEKREQRVRREERFAPR